MKSKTSLQLSVILGAIVFMMAGLSSVYAVSCGDVLDSGGTVVLDTDLACSTNVVLTVTNGTILDLNGHTLRGNRVGTGVILDGAGSGLKNGTIWRNAVSVVLKGTGGHLVRNVTIHGGDVAIDSRSDGNVIENCKADTLRGSAFDIGGNKNWLINNIVNGANGDGFIIYGGNTCLLWNKASGADGGGFHVFSSNNKLLRNIADANSQLSESGILVDGGNNWLIRNRARRNTLSGITVEGRNNRMIRNRAKDSTYSFDLVDTNTDCDGNIWKKNFFGTRDPATCIE